MIVKAISHRNTHKSAIQKLIDYVFNPEKMIDVHENREAVMVKQFIPGYDTDKWADAFKENDDNRTFTHTKRTVLRHEIISFSPESRTFLDKEKLKAFAGFYLKNRCPQSLGVCAVHYDEAIHIHFIISGVTIEGKSTRVSQKDFRAFKIQLQEFQQQKYPELSHSVVDHSKKLKKKVELNLTRAEQQMNRRGALSEKQKVSRQVMQVAKSCNSLDELAQKLNVHSIQTYERNGRLAGVLLGNRKYRLTTLGVGTEHLKQLTLEQKRLDGITRLKQQRKTRGLER